MLVEGDLHPNHYLRIRRLMPRAGWVGVDPKDIIPMRAFAGQSEQQPLHFAVIFGRSMMSCLGMFCGRYVWLLHIYFQYTNWGCRKNIFALNSQHFQKGTSTRGLDYRL